MSPISIGVFVSVAILSASILPTTAEQASADPGTQALALVESTAPVPLSCDEQACSARLTSFCLEPERRSPLAGERYGVAAGDIVLISRGPDGTKHTNVTALTTLTVERGHRAVRLSIPIDVTTRSAGTDLFIDVGPMVTLLPVEETPSSVRDPAELALLTGPLRALGAANVDYAGPEIDAARVLNRAIDGLPKVGRGGLGTSGGAWRQSLVASGSDSGRELAGQAYHTCQRKAASGLYYSLRNCLIQRHDDLTQGLNEDYWQRRAGS